MALLNHKAKTLVEAIKNLEHIEALALDELRDYYVSRDDKIIKRLALALQQDYPKKFLFTGHRGSGKSTELAKLEERLRDDFFIVRFSVERQLDLFDINYLDVLLSIALQMLDKANQQGVVIDVASLEVLWSFAKEIEEETTTSTNVGGGAEVGVLGKVLSPLLDLKLKFGAEHTTRQTVREKVQYQVSDLLRGIEVLADDILKHTQKKVLCIIEDLDKTDLAKSKNIFYEHGQSISRPNIGIIYTFPVALQNNNDFKQVESYFADHIFLPNFQCFTKDGQRAEEYEDVKRIIENRIASNLINTDALEMLVEACGGVPRILLQLTKDAVLEAEIAEAEKVDVSHAKTAIEREQRSYQRMLTDEQMALLKVVRDTKRMNPSQENLELLHNLSILEYLNGQTWHMVNPLVLPLLEDFEASEG